MIYLKRLSFATIECAVNEAESGQTQYIGRLNATGKKNETFLQIEMEPMQTNRIERIEMRYDKRRRKIK